MELLFVRHAQPAWAPDGRSVDNPDLTELGQRQAHHLANVLERLEIDHLLVSPLRRAEQTAAPLVERTGIKPVVLEWLAEITAPRFEGTPVEQVERVFSESKGRPIAEQWEGIPGGESFTDFHKRVTTGLEQLLATHGATPSGADEGLWHLDQGGERIVIVAHAGTNSVALGHLLGISPVPWEWERFVSYHASVTTIEPLPMSGAQAFSLHRFADVGHLPDDIRTR